MRSPAAQAALATRLSTTPDAALGEPVLRFIEAVQHTQKASVPLSTQRGVVETGHSLQHHFPYEYGRLLADIARSRIRLYTYRSPKARWDPHSLAGSPSYFRVAGIFRKLVGFVNLLCVKDVNKDVKDETVSFRARAGSVKEAGVIWHANN